MISRSHSPENDVFALDIIPNGESKIPGMTTIDFDGLLAVPIVLHEDLKDGCGGQLWPAGMALAKYMLQNHRDLADKSIIEIGAGGGLVGLAVANGCQTSNGGKLFITDQIPMLSLMKTNITMNSLDSKVQAAVYDWGTTLPASITSRLSASTEDATVYPDIVLAADCVYFEPAFPLLLQTLKDLIGPTTVCYFCFKKRRKADLRFIRDMKKTFSVQEISYEDVRENVQNSIFLYDIRSKAFNRAMQ